MAPLMWKVPVTLNHNGIKEAITRGYDSETNVLVPTQSTVTKHLEKLATTDHKYAIVGSVIDYFEAKGGGFYAIFTVNIGLDAISWLITRGHIYGVSLTSIYPKEWDGHLVPYELTLCRRPKRPHCFIVAASRDLLPVAEYKRRLQTGVIRDRSGVLKRPDAIRMMASTADVPADAPPQPPQLASADAPTETSSAPEDPMDVVGKILDEMPEDKSAVLTTGYLNMKRDIDKGKAEAAKARAEADAARKEAAELRAAKDAALKAAKNSDINAGLLKSYVDMLKTGLGKTRSGQFITPEVIDGTSSLDEAVRANSLTRVIHAAAYGVLEMQGDNYFDSSTSESAPGTKRMRPSERLAAAARDDASYNALPTPTPEPAAATPRDMRTRVEPHMASANAPDASMAASADPSEPVQTSREALKGIIAGQWFLQE